MERSHSKRESSSQIACRPFFAAPREHRDSQPFFTASDSGLVQRQTESAPKREDEEQRLQQKPQDAAIQRMCTECAKEYSEQQTLQPKLTVGEMGDAYEQEADRVAEQLTGQLQTSHATSIQTRSDTILPRITPLVMRRGEGSPTVSPQVEQQIQHARGAGEAITQPIRGTMEQALGADFSSVRIHVNSEADSLNRSLNSRAFTTGKDIYFKSGEYQPESPEGQKLLAHELTHVIQQSDASGIHAIGSQERHAMLQRTPGQAGSEQGAQQRICGPDITTSLTTMLGTVEPWFMGLSSFQQSRSCMGLGPLGFLAGVNPVMAWDTRQLFLPNTYWLDSYFRRHSCGFPRDAGCTTDPTRHLCETAGTCGNSVVVDSKCMLAGTANYALFGKICRVCHDYTGRWNRWDMRATIGAWKTVDGDDSTPPKEVASAAYDGTFPTVSAAAENRRNCTGRCGQTHSGAFDFIWEPYKPR